MATLHARAFTVPRPWSAGEIRDLLASVHSFAVSEPGGFAIARVVAGEAEILTIAVAPECRRQGIGSRLVAAVIATARLRHAEVVMLEVAVENHAARALYARAGFTETARRPGYYRPPGGAPLDALMLSLPLTPDRSGSPSI